MTKGENTHAMRYKRPALASMGYDMIDSKHCQLRKGKVVYIHPKGRYHVVEFACETGTIREAFQGVIS